MLEPILKIVSRYRNLGEVSLPSGCFLTGKIPHIGPDAYLHSIFAGLDVEEIDQIEKAVDRKLPTPLKYLFKEANGFKFFGDTLSFFGSRLIQGRSTASSRQPYDISISNIEERPSDAPSDAIFFGCFDWDGSLLYMTLESDEVLLCSRESAKPLFKWHSINDMLKSESARLSKHFDDKGIEINISNCTLPT